MQTNNQNSNSPINPKLGSSVTNAIKNAEAGELPALDDISNITNRVVEKIKASENILIALSKNPNIDEISAALGLAMILDTMRKHVTAIFSGQVPNVLQFLKPEETFEKTTNSLQDFIIALSKDKVDHISYKIEGDFVKVYVTPYKATIGQADLSMSHGDYNVDLVICFNVISGDEIDPALSEYGRIMHDATAINLTVDTPGRFAELEWQDSNVSSISEMIVDLADRLGLASFSEQVATALLTGIVASTDHFSNPRTSSNTMSIASKLMSFGANQQLISSQIMEKIKTPAETQVSNEAQVSNGVQALEAVQAPETSIIATAPAAPVTPAVPATPAVTVGSAPVESIPVSDSPLDYIEIEPNPNQTLDGQPLEFQSNPAAQSFESQISPTPQAIESQSAPIPQSLEPQQAPAYQAPINPAAAAASAVMEDNFIQNPEPSLPQPNYTNETPNYQAPVMPTPPLNFAQNLATSAPFAAPAPLATSVPLTQTAPLAQSTPLVTPIPQEQPMQYSAPVQPAQQIQQVQPVQPIQPTQYVQPTQYPESASPVQPMQFTAPFSQAQSMPYVEPMQPTPMAAPSEPVQFTQPVQPMAPIPPVQPMEPMQSMPSVPPAPVIFDAASMPNQPLTNDQAFVNSAPVDLMPPMPPMPPEAPSTPDVDFFAQAAAATEAAQLNQSPINSVASSPIPADLDPVSTPAPAPVEAPVEPPLRTFASDSPLISQPVDTTAPAAAPIAEPAAIFSPEEPAEPAPAKIDPTAFHIPGM